MTSSCSALPFSGSYRADLELVLVHLLSLLPLCLLFPVVLRSPYFPLHTPYSARPRSGPPLGIEDLLMAISTSTSQTCTQTVRRRDVSPEP
jgi:hypothetical protein